MTSAPVAFCDHGRLGMHCEDCAYVRALERGRNLSEPPEPDEKPAPTIAGEDLLFEVRPGVRELVAAGDPIPARLLDLPRKGRDSRAPEVANKTPGKRRAGRG